MRYVLSLITTLIIFAVISFLLWQKRTRHLALVPAKLDSYWDSLKERRKFRRFNSSLSVECSFSEQSNNVYHVFSKDISGEGICIQVSEIIPEGSLLDLKIDVPETKPISVKGKIVWVDESPRTSNEQDRVFNAGIQFVKVDTRDKKRLRDFLDVVAQEGTKLKRGGVRHE